MSSLPATPATPPTPPTPPTPAAPNTPRPPGWARWAQRALLAWLNGVVLVVGWRFALVPASSPPWRDGLPDGFATQPLSPSVVVVIAAIALSVLVAGRWPRAAAVVALAASAVYLAMGGRAVAVVPALAIVLVGVVAQLGVARAWPWVAALVPVYLAAHWDTHWLGLVDPATWESLASALMWTLVPALVAQLVLTRRAASARLRAEELRQAAADERLRVARDIHDVVGHSLSMISLQSGVALRVLDADPGQARASLEAIRGSSKDALAELRHTLGVFRDGAPLAPTPGLAAIPGLVERTRAGGIRVDADLPGTDGVPAATQAVAYRVIQEALTNAMRHAPGAPVRVGVRRDSDTLVVRVADAGPPGATVVEGSGLRGMRERVAALGGTLSVTAGAGGVTVEAVLPVLADEQGPDEGVRA